MLTPEAVSSLRAVRPRIVVRSTAAGGGAVALDRFLARAYRPVARFGGYAVLRRRITPHAEAHERADRAKPSRQVIFLPSA